MFYSTQGPAGQQGEQGLQGDTGAIGPGLIFIPRDDASAYDFVKDDFTQDGAWRALNLASIIPAGARVILFQVGFGATATGKSFHVKPFTDSTEKGATIFQTLVANLPQQKIGVCGCVSQEVYYKAVSATWSWIDFTVLGWWELV